MKTKVNLSGPKGRISALLQQPALAEGQKCPLVILMHGFMANKALQPLKGIAQALEAEGIASLRILAADLLPACLCVDSLLVSLCFRVHYGVGYPCEYALLGNSRAVLSPPLSWPACWRVNWGLAK